MGIDGLASNEEVLDFAGSFEDAIDAHVAENAFHRLRSFAARRERLRSLVTTAAANLQQLVGNLPHHLGIEKLRHRRFQP